jgi:hypothetical protein
LRDTNTLSSAKKIRSNQISIDIFVLITTNGVNSWEEEQRKASSPILTYEDFRKNKKNLGVPNPYYLQKDWN